MMSPGGRLRRVDVGGDVDRPPPVDPLDRGVAAAEFHLGHLGERHLGAVGGVRMRHVFHVAQRAAFGLGETHHHLDVVATALDALGLFPVESLAHLPGQIGQRQAEHLRRGG